MKQQVCNKCQTSITGPIHGSLMCPTCFEEYKKQGWEVHKLKKQARDGKPKRKSRAKLTCKKCKVNISAPIHGSRRCRNCYNEDKRVAKSKFETKRFEQKYRIKKELTT